MPTFEATQKGYANLWSKMIVTPAKLPALKALAARLNANRVRYEIIASRTGVPWHWIAIAHNLEGGGNFKTYLGNGQPLTQRTTIVPIGRGPFQNFEAGAIDALALHGLDKIKDWSIPRLLYEWEKWNGWGYLGKVNSPYLWSFTSLYTSGKYVADHVYNAAAVSAQAGAAALLRVMIDMGYVSINAGESGMNELKAVLEIFRAVAPTAATAIGGPVAGLIAKTIADEFGTSGDDPGETAKKINATPAKEAIAKMQEVEKTVTQIIPAPPIPAELPVPAVAAPPVPVVPVEPQKTIVPITPGPGIGILTGYKTIIGIIVIGGAYAAGQAHFITPDIVGAIQGLGFTIGGVGLYDAVSRYLPGVLAKKV